MGLDYVAVQEKGPTPEGDLGRKVYKEKVQDNLSIYIPTTNYVRLGIGCNMNTSNVTFDFNGSNKAYDSGWSEYFGFGWNLFSFVRGEMGFVHNNFKFGDSSADIDTMRGMLYFDLFKRQVLQGDVMYRRTFNPFVGVGVGLGYADFSDTDFSSGKDSVVQGGYAAVGLSFAFSNINAIDLMVQYEYSLSNRAIGWGGNEKEFNTMSLLLSWRSSF